MAVGNLLPTGAREGRDGKHYPARPPTAIYTTTAGGVTRAARVLERPGRRGSGKDAITSSSGHARSPGEA